MTMAQPDQPPDEPTTLDIALGYARRGWRVVPISPGKKYPTINAWQKAGTTDEARIRHWWTEAPDHGVGIVTGRESGIFVLDVDVAGDKAGDDTLAELVDGYGPLPDTYEVVTGSGGRHIYFAWPEGQEIRNDAGKRLGPGLDIRGEGGQVLAPPTIHPNGSPYAVEASAPLFVAEAPGWLLALLADPEPVVRTTPAHVPAWDPFAGVEGSSRPIDAWASEHGWNDLLINDGWTLHHTDASGEEHWTRPGKDRREGTSATLGYKGSDVLKVFTSSHPTLVEGETYTRQAYYVATRHRGDWKAAAAALRPATTASMAYAEVDAARLATQWKATSVAPQVDVSAVADAVLEQIAEHPDEVVVPFADTLVDWHDLFGGTYEAEDWLCEPFLARGRAHSLYAPAKAGKSLLMLYIAAAMASGRPIFGRPASEPRRVLYVDMEMTHADLRERLAEMGYEDPSELAELRYATLPALSPLDTPEGGLALLMMAKGLGVELVVIDTLSRVIAGEENSADTIRAFARCTGTPLKAHGIAVVRLDHAGKDLEKGERGTSAKRDDVDVVWQLIPRDRGAFDVRATHRRTSWIQETVSLVQHDDPLRYEVVEDTWPEGTKDVADTLTAAGAPIEIKRTDAREILKAAGVGARNEVLGAALRWRRREATHLLGRSAYPQGYAQVPVEGPGRGPDLSTGGDRGRGPKTETPSDLRGPGRGPAGTEFADSGDRSPPLRGDRPPSRPDHDSIFAIDNDEEF